jgi:hypothetical protein
VEQALWEGAHLVWLAGLLIEGGGGQSGVGDLFALIGQGEAEEDYQVGKELGEDWHVL